MENKELELSTSTEWRKSGDPLHGRDDVLSQSQRDSYLREGLTHDTITKIEKSEKEKIDKRMHSYTLVQSKSDPPDGDSRTINVVLVGKTGVGLSSTGNLLLGQDDFKTSSSPTSVTTSVIMREANVHGQLIRVIDTPGLCHTTISEQKMKQELGNVFKLCPDGIDAFLYVHSLAGQRFSNEDNRCKQLLEDFFGSHFKKHAVLVLTHADTSLIKTNLCEYQFQNKESKDPLGHFIEVEVNNRVVAINNHAESGYERNALRRLLLDQIYAVIKHNRGLTYRPPRRIRWPIVIAVVGVVIVAGIVIGLAVHFASS